MLTLRNIIILFTISAVCACTGNKAHQEQPEKVIKDPVAVQLNKSIAVKSDEEVVDSSTTFKFNELSVSINSLIIEDDSKKLEQIQKDTATVYVELGETIEGQLLSVKSDQLTNLKVEQRFETSVTIMNEGPHCDLTEWKHFYPDWKQLRSNQAGQFICAKYTEKEKEQFPAVAIADLKKKVKEQCGDSWAKMIENIKSPIEYPSAVGVSRQFIRITGTRKDNGVVVTKVIVVEEPMGC